MMLGGLDMVSVGREEGVMRGREGETERKGREEGTASDNGGLLKAHLSHDRHECHSINATLGERRRRRRREESAGGDRSQTGMEETSLSYGSKEANVGLRSGDTIADFVTTL